THALDERHGLVQREPLRVVMMGKLREALVDKLYAAAVEERSVARRRHQHRPTAVIRYADDAARHRTPESRARETARPHRADSARRRQPATSSARGRTSRPHA